MYLPPSCRISVFPCVKLMAYYVYVGQSKRKNQHKGYSKNCWYGYLRQIYFGTGLRTFLYEIPVVSTYLRKASTAFLVLPNYYVRIFSQVQGFQPSKWVVSKMWILGQIIRVWVSSDSHWLIWHQVLSRERDYSNQCLGLAAYWLPHSLLEKEITFVKGNATKWLHSSLRIFSFKIGSYTDSSYCNPNGA